MPPTEMPPAAVSFTITLPSVQLVSVQPAPLPLVTFPTQLVARPILGIELHRDDLGNVVERHRVEPDRLLSCMPAYDVYERVEAQRRLAVYGDDAPPREQPRPA